MNETIPENFFKVADKFGNKTALMHKKSGSYVYISYNELSEQVEIFAEFLQNIGVKKGDKIAILSENRPEWVVADLATMAVGAITVPLHTVFIAKTISKILEHSEAKIIIVSNGRLFKKIFEGTGQIEKVIFLENNIPENLLSGIEIIKWESIFLQNKKNKFKRNLFHQDDICSIIYTSGTTGEPKGVMLSHKNFLSNVDAVDKAIPVKKEDIFLSFLPLSHVFERMAGYYMPLLRGARVAYAQSVKDLSLNIKEVRPSLLICVPRVFEKFNDEIWDRINASVFKKNIFTWALAQKKNSFMGAMADFFVFRKVRKEFGGRVRLTISGGAALNAKIAKFFHKIGILVLEGYGLTETSPVISANMENNFKFGSVGKIMEGVEVKISPSKEILVKGPNVFTGYYKDQSYTNYCFDKEGWFHTGDLGFFDNSGFLTIIGRAKEMIVTSGGKNIWPEPIENMLNDDRFIWQSVILGDKRKFVSALIVPDWQEMKIYFNGKIPTSQQVQEIIRQRIEEKINPDLDDFEKIKKFRILPKILSAESGELTATLKLRRHIILEKNRQLIESMY